MLTFLKNLKALNKLSSEIPKNKKVKIVVKMTSKPIKVEVENNPEKLQITTDKPIVN